MEGLSNEQIEKIISENTGLIFAAMKALNLLGDADAESAGYEALYRAVKMYDATKSTAKFSSYAYRAIFNRVNGVHRSRSTLISKNTLPVAALKDNDLYIEGLFKSEYNMENKVIIDDKLEKVLAFIENYIDMMPDGLQRNIMSNWYYLHECDVLLTELCEECNCSHAYCRKVLKTFRERLNKAFRED